jgi:hypothetical protein
MQQSLPYPQVPPRWAIEERNRLDKQCLCGSRVANERRGGASDVGIQEPLSAAVETLQRIQAADRGSPSAASSRASPVQR